MANTKKDSDKWKKYYRDKQRKRAKIYRSMSSKDKDDILNEYSKTYRDLLNTLEEKNNARYINERKTK